MKFSSVLAGAALVGSALADVDPIVIKGSKFFYKTNGTEFFMRGVAYQQEVGTHGAISGDKYQDPLADVEACKRDIPLLQELGTNTIRVYAVDPEADHEECMQMLQDAGIYVVADLSEPGTSIITDDPKWDDVLYARYTSVVDMMSKYPNTLGFFAGNEVSNNKTNTPASAFVKAAVRDMKAYIKQKNYRPMGVGYATNDDGKIREDLADYFNCGTVEDSIDFWGYNIYSWCDPSTYEESGYDARTKEFADYSVPVFFAEYGCNKNRPRLFNDAAALYSDKMTSVWSGGIVYMYFQEANDYGLVKLDGDKATKMSDFENLADKIAKADPSGVQMDSYTPTNTALRSCPTIGDTWQASETLPPTPNQELCSCMSKSLSCVVSDSVKTEDLKDLFDTVCGYGDSCVGINPDATKGVYGAYSMCSDKEKLSFAFDTYYQSQLSKGNGDNACDFDGAATKQTATEAEGTCKDLMSQAGSDGTGTVTSAPSGVAGSGDSSETSTGAASNLMVAPEFNFGMLKLGAYLVSAAMAGAGLILL
ncbi:1,3-beta-glucanosyltransferase gas1 [Arachnomyces sp. PD_36]|nr:1,3-beta-glucanosyltransferase gas1 [Arachnomyces sp. PD_36]